MHHVVYFSVNCKEAVKRRAKLFDLITCHAIQCFDSEPVGHPEFVEPRGRLRVVIEDDAPQTSLRYDVRTVSLVQSHEYFDHTLGQTHH